MGKSQAAALTALRTILGDVRELDLVCRARGLSWAVKSRCTHRLWKRGEKAKSGKRLPLGCEKRHKKDKAVYFQTE